jgi:tetratricopeptide (TPR) repeat protein
MRVGVLAAAVVVALTTACAPKAVPLPNVPIPRFPEFTRPAVPTELQSTSGAEHVNRAWVFLQAGDLRNADREVAAAQHTEAGFYPADATAGWIALARRDASGALAQFDQALTAAPAYLSALVGRGRALVSLDRPGDAAAAFEAALAVDGSLVDLRRQVQVLRFQNLQSELARARRAQAAGDLEEAKAAYTNALTASPDSGYLYRELGSIERQLGNMDEARQHLDRALALDPGDAQAHVEIGQLLEARGDLAGAEQAYTEALALDPGDAPIVDRRDAVAARRRFERLPLEYQQIAQKPQATRGDLAALIGVRLAPVVQQTPSRNPGVITDVAGHWANLWILAVANAGLMEPYANHTFQPGATLRRSDLAEVASRLLSEIARGGASEVRAWQEARVSFSDIAPGHLAYRAASTAVAAGIMSTDDHNAFRPSDAVSGAEVEQAVDRLQALAATASQMVGRSAR